MESTTTLFRPALPLICCASLLFSAGAALAQKPTAAKTRKAAEIELRGRVQAVLVAEKRLVLEATEVSTVNGTAGGATPIDPPRPKTIVIDATTVLRDDSLAGQTGRPVKLADLKPEFVLAVTGASAGEGQPMTARLVRVLPDPDAGRVNLLPATADPAPWTFESAPEAKASIAADSGALKISLAAPAPAERAVHLGKGFLDIAQKHVYRLRFRAKADKERPLRIVTMATWPERPTGLDKSVTLGTDWKDFDIRFESNDPSPDKQNAIDFWFGEKEGTVWIADASLKDVSRRVVRPVREGLLNGLLRELQSGNASTRKQAADKLASMSPEEEYREAVADGLVAVFSDPDLFVRWSAVKAMGVWATPDTIPALVKKLGDPEHAVRWATMDSLAQLRDRRAARPLAEMVVRGQDRHFAAEAMRKMGAVSVESSVWILGTASDWEARNEACETLALCAGSESIPALRAATRDSNGIVRMAADKAIQSIATSGRR